jgi:hypothetical protein
MKVILKYNNTCRGSLVLHSYPDSFEIVSAVLRKLKMYENATPPPLKVIQKVRFFTVSIR